MDERAAWARAHLDRLAARCPPALELARLVSPAVTIDPALLRAMRLEMMPGHGAWIESELWFSSLVKTRSVSGIRFEEAISDQLRAELAAAWHDPARGARIRDARSLMEATHAALSPALALEERVAWAAVAGDPDAINDELARAVKAALDPARPGMTAWANGALSRLPRASFGTEAGQALLALARRGRAERPQVSVSTGESPDMAAALATPDEPATLFETLPTVRIGVARRGPLLLLGPFDAAPFAIPTAATEPRLLELWQEDESGVPLRQRLALAPRERRTVQVGTGRVQIRNARNEHFDVPGFSAWAGGQARWQDLLIGFRPGAREFQMELQGPGADDPAIIVPMPAGDLADPALFDTARVAGLPAGEKDRAWTAHLGRIAAAHPIPEALAGRLHADTDLALHVDPTAGRVPWEYLLLAAPGHCGRLVRKPANLALKRMSPPPNVSRRVLLANLGGRGAHGMRRNAEAFSAARFDVDTVEDARTLSSMLFGREWQVVHVEAEAGSGRRRDGRSASPGALTASANAVLTPEEVARMEVKPGLLVIHQHGFTDTGFAFEWGPVADMDVTVILVNGWSVPDAMAGLFLDVFHTVLLAGSTAAEACVIARLELRRRHPDTVHWAAFQLHGQGDYRLPAPVEAPWRPTHRVSAAGLNLRAEPGTKAPAVIVLPRDTEVEALDSQREDDWVHVRTRVEGLFYEGFVAQRFLESLEVTTEAERLSYELRAIRSLEAKAVPHPGLHRLDPWPDPPKLSPVSARALTGSGPVLLLLHGMASSSIASFHGIWSNEHRRELGRLKEQYGGRIFCFEHWGLSRSPIENTLALVKALPPRVTLHILSSSNGGLIGELLCRAQRVDGPPIDEADLTLFEGADRQALAALAEELKTRTIRIERFVRVGCPALGTTYPMRAKQVFGTLARVLSAVGSLASSLPLKLLDAIVDPGRVPGLQAMDPGNPLIRMLNRRDVLVASDLAVIAGCFRPESVGGRIKAGMIGLLLDQDNDLLVPTASMLGGAARTEGGRFVRFEGGEINHFSYLEQADVIRTAINGLLDDVTAQPWNPLPVPTQDWVQAS